MAEARYGTWTSPISAELIAATGNAWSRFERPEPTEDGLYWLESRPAEGRTALVFMPWDEEPRDVVPSGFNVRNSVHEYGGGAYFLYEDTAFCTNFDDQRLYRVEAGAEPQALTPEPPEPRALRYADGVVTPDGATIVCVRERHEAGDVINELVSLPADGSTEPTVIASGHDFFSSPALSHDGSQLAYLSWDHPSLPFIGTDLRVSTIGGEPRHVAGGPDESIFQPQWSPDGTLHFVSDRSGWWNLYTEAGPVAPVEAELGWMQWVFAASSYVFVPDGRIACTLNRGSRQPLTYLDPESGSYEEADVPYDSLRFPWLRSHGTKLSWIAASATEPPAILLLDAASGKVEVVKTSVGNPIDEALVSRAEAIEFPTGEGGTGYGFYYAPKNPAFSGPAGERPPLVVSVHGGPTAQSVAGVEPAFVYLTSRGIGIVDVNYGGSTGYGRAYLERLKGEWGPVDTADSIAAARYLVERGDADGDRIAITGGSAGGYTTLYALTFEDFFATGASFFGVTDLIAFNETTHKFESHYDHWLLGPYPEEEEKFRERSPAESADDLDVPVLLLQGLDDKVVPPSQAEIMVEALRRNGVPFAYIAFEGEGHGFRRAENIRRSNEACLSFFSRVWGFEPADDLPPLAIENL